MTPTPGSKLRVLAVGHTYVKASYRGKWRVLAKTYGCDVTVVVPRIWREQLFDGPSEREPGDDVVVRPVPIAFTGRNYAYFFRRHLGQILQAAQPHVVHVEEEPWSASAVQVLATSALAVPSAKRIGFTWENASLAQRGVKRLLENLSFRLAHTVIAGSAGAADVLAWKGYVGPRAVLPQHGCDRTLFRPETRGLPSDAETIVVGFSGRLVPEKGIELLLRAVAITPHVNELHVMGTGPEESHLRSVAATLGIERRIRWWGRLAPTELADHYRKLDVLVLPSTSDPLGWKEQFGRALVEGMASGVPVVGSSSGAISEVIGDAGLSFAQGDVSDLARCLHKLREPTIRRQLREAGLRRVEQHYTDEAIAASTLDLYRRLIEPAAVNPDPISKQPSVERGSG